MFAFFSKDKALERKHRRFGKKLLNMFTQSPERRYAAQQLAELRTPEAIELLLGRFEKRATNHTLDKEEKTEVRDYLVEMGPSVVEPTTAYLKGKALNVNWPIRVLRHFLSTAELADLLADLLDAEDLEYGRNPERKEELVLAAGDFTSDRLGASLVRMLDDANEPVRFSATSALLKHGYPFAAERLMACLADKDESQRTAGKILERAVETEWTVSDQRAAIEGNLPEGYAVTRAGTIRRRGSTSQAS